MDKLNALVAQHLSERLLQPERLADMLQSLASRRLEKAAAVDRRIAGLEKEARTAEDRLRRLYMLIETGLAEIDDVLKRRIEELKLDLDRASAALERVKDGAAQRIDITPALLDEFGRTMREKLGSGDDAFRRAYIAALVDRIEVDDAVVRIIGRKEVIEQAVMASAAMGSEVRTFVPKWLRG